MELSRKAINEIRLRNKRGKYYVAEDVDDALDAIAEAAEKQSEELERLRQVESEYLAQKMQIGELLIAAKGLATQYSEQERTRCVSELRDIETKKLRLRQEIQALEKQKSDMVGSLKREMSALLSQLEGSMPREEAPISEILRMSSVTGM